MWTCKHCKKEYDLLTANEKANHSRWCLENPKRNDYINKGSAIEAMRNKVKETGYFNQYTKAKLLGLPVPENKNKGKPGISRKHTEEEKKRSSESRKEWLKNNPDKHPWKKNNKFKSEPCEKFKQILKDNNISYVEEFQPLFPERFFSVDIAFPNKKIAIEINGNQHYNADKTLKEYYQKRHDLLVTSGWTIYEYHYSIAYSDIKMKEIVKKLQTDHDLSTIDYSFYIKETFDIQQTHDICVCGSKKRTYSKLCAHCSNISKKPLRQKFVVTKEELEKLIHEYSFLQIGNMYGVSDSAIRKRCISMGIEIPKREPGYWAKKYAGKI